MDQKNMVVTASWLYKRGSRKARFHCTKFLFECRKIFQSFAAFTFKLFFNTMLCSLYSININEIPNHFSLKEFTRLLSQLY